MARRTRIVNSIGIAALALAAACASDPASTGADPGIETVADTVTGDATDTEPDAAPVQESSELDIVGAALAVLDDPAADATVGAAAPVITGASFDGTPITIGGAADGPTMLVFLAHWCPHCNDEIPELNELRDSGAIPAGVEVIGVSTAVAADRPNFPPSTWIVEKDWTWPVLADSTASEAFQMFGGSGFPYTVMLDASGNVLARTAGSSSAAQIDAWIDAALA